jgi:hypothetical protein
MQKSDKVVCSHHSYSRIALEFLARPMGQETEINKIQIEKKEVKLSLFANDKILYLKDPEDSNKNC